MSPTRKASSVRGGLRSAVTSPAAPVPVHPSPASESSPASEVKAEKWPARISMTASREMKRDLEAARLDDGLEVTARLRAMIKLWQSDPELRARVDELAKDLR